MPSVNAGQLCIIADRDGGMPRKQIAGRKRRVKIHAVDIFCGIGGLTHGIAKEGVVVKAGFDIDPSCKYAYEENNPGAKFVPADVRKLRFCDIAPYYKGADVKVLVGCAPCQPFSAHTRKIGTASRSDDCSLLGEFGRLVKEGEPDIVSMENVPGLVRHQAFGDFVAMLEKLGYKCDSDVVSCLDYGIPQTRTRLVLLASRLGEISLLRRPRWKAEVVADRIKGMPEIGGGHRRDKAHIALELSEVNKRRIRQSKPGGSWKDWDSSIVNKCHREAYYPAPYGRMRWDAPAPTITTQFCYYSTGRFGHPTQHRTISVREAAMLQTFPRWYKLAERGEPIVVRDMARHIGNAVPVKLAKAIGKSIKEGANA